MELIRYTLPRRRSLLVPLGDLQWDGDTRSLAFGYLKDTVKRAVDQDAVFLGMGDYIDFASPSNREALNAARTYDTARKILSNKARELTEEVFERVLKPTKGRWIGLLEGHHWYPLIEGITSDQRLCQLLDATFLGTSAIIRLAFEGGQHSVTAWAHHGTGGGQTVGAGLNKLEKVRADYERVDIFLMGHTTKRGAIPIPRVYPVWEGRPKLVHSDAWLINTGGWLKGYVEGAREGRTPRGNYVEKAMLRPVSLGAPAVWLTPERHRKGPKGKEQNFYSVKIEPIP